MTTLRELPTPCLVLERDVLERSCARMKARAAALGVSLRPHLKTAKSIEVARRAADGAITVSTLREASYFLEHGVRDLTYAVGLDPAKIDACEALVARGARLTVITDDVDVARALAERDPAVRVLIEIDVGQHRGGIDAESDELLAIAGVLARGRRMRLAGVLAHAGHSYGAASIAEITSIAEDERARTVRAATRLREAGHDVETVSVGSTPTAVHAAHLGGVTELRAGVYTFFDRFQHAIGSCGEDDLALTVLASVIGVRRGEGVVLIDAGSLALSADRSMERFGGGYGEVRDLRDAPLGARVTSVNQEHGMIAGAPSSLRIGDRVRIRPNHACITAAMHAEYAVVAGDERVIARWDRVNGW
ncbi:alanine racemase [Sandaracinus amylolyticus]|uniref:alanine racemase n=1 Tax=Sandaracinus amylolyticus TaxID=927083 RepID=UPI00069F632C|nr:alanine racemase [Sandaracinus amylolyticus]